MYIAATEEKYIQEILILHLHISTFNISCCSTISQVQWRCIHQQVIFASVYWDPYIRISSCDHCPIGSGSFSVVNTNLEVNAVRHG